MGSISKGRECSLGGIFAGILEGNARNRNKTGSIEVPQEYRVEALIYPAISKGYVTLQGLADGSISMKTFLEARKLIEFEEWLKDQKPATSNDEVEYFD